MFSFSGPSIPSFEPGVGVPVNGLFHRVLGNDPGAVADEFGEFERAFTEPTLLDQRHYRQRVLDYLDDDSVSPLPFRRMADRDPTPTSEVPRRVLGRKSFDWQRDGEKLMRQRKRSFIDRAPLPRILPFSARLAPYVGTRRVRHRHPAGGRRDELDENLADPARRRR
jgi:hypothetical protein